MEKSWNCVFEFLWEPCFVFFQDEQDMRHCLNDDLSSRRDGRATNVFTVLTRYGGEAQDGELIKVL